LSNRTLLARLAKEEDTRAEEGKAGLVEKAFVFAEKEFKSKKKDSTKDLQHSTRVAKNLFDLGFDYTTIAAGILHDSVLKLGTDPEKIGEVVGKEVEAIVVEYTKIREIETKNIGTFDKSMLSTVVLATAKDLRSLFVKFVARLDHLQNDTGLEKKGLIERAEGALHIYAPICQKLGFYDLQGLLEDNSLKILQPKVYNNIKELIGKTKIERGKELENAIAEFWHSLSKENKKISVQGRTKSIYSIYKKMGEQNRPFEEIYDLLGIRIICDSVRQCYELLGIVHSEYKTVPNQFTDYVANPKKNGYRSLHTVVMWEKQPLEVQIRTWEMHYECETGLAAHWQYKHYAKDRFFDERLSLAKQLVEWHLKARETGNLASSLKMEFGQNRIFVLTPKHRVVVLPEGSSPIDFAFAIHSDLGSKCQKAKVNGKAVTLSHVLDNADVVEIIKSKQVQIKRQWLGFAKSGKALSKIKQKLGIKPPKKKAVVGRKLHSLTSDKNIRIAKCCNPLPGDEILGVRTTKRKVSVHRENCKNVAKTAKKKIVKIKWGIAEKHYIVGVGVKATDSPGLLPAILKIISGSKATLVSTDAKTIRNKVLQCKFNVKIKNITQLDNMISKIRALPRVFETSRE